MIDWMFLKATSDQHQTFPEISQLDPACIAHAPPCNNAVRVRIQWSKALNWKVFPFNQEPCSPGWPRPSHVTKGNRQYALAKEVEESLASSIHCWCQELEIMEKWLKEVLLSSRSNLESLTGCVFKPREMTAAVSAASTRLQGLLLDAGLLTKSPYQGINFWILASRHQFQLCSCCQSTFQSETIVLQLRSKHLLLMPR